MFFSGEALPQKKFFHKKNAIGLSDLNNASRRSCEIISDPAFGSDVVANFVQRPFSQSGGFFADPLAVGEVRDRNGHTAAGDGLL